MIYKISPAEGSSTKLSRGRDMEWKVWLWLHLYKHPTLSRWILVTQRSMCDVLCEWRQVWLRWFFLGDEGESSVGLKDTQQKRCKSLQGCSADGLPKGRPFLSSKTEESGRTKDIDSSIYLDVDMFFYILLYMRQTCNAFVWWIKVVFESVRLLSDLLRRWYRLTVG